MNVWLLSTIVLPIVNAKLQSEFYAGCETQPGNSSVLAEQHRNCLIHYLQRKWRQNENCI